MPDRSPPGLSAQAITVEDPTSADCAAVLAQHLAFANAVTPVGHVHALDPSRLAVPEVTFFGARRLGRLLGVGAVRMIDEAHAELKSMHTLEEARGSGLGSALVASLIDEARMRGAQRVSLETGTYPAFAAARALYAGFGFERCPPFAEYTDNPYSICMTLEIGGREQSKSRTPLPPIDLDAVRRFWLRTPFAGSRPPPDSVEYFGDSAELASELVTLVVHGPKRATAGDLASFEREGLPLPRAGNEWIVLDGAAVPRAVLVTTEVRIGPLTSVDDSFAWDEGEGNRTRAWWLDAHTRFFERNLPAGQEFSPDMQVVFERFDLAYSEA